MFPINNVKTFKDSVHGYIDVPKCFVDKLIDNDYFQRLRNIDQTGMRVLYPNAKHDRFTHSLGVFHLGQRAVNTLLDNFSKDQYWHIESDNQSSLYWAKNKVLFLIACLLHDIGHAPFSHALELQLLKSSKAPVSATKKCRGKAITPVVDNKDYVTSELQRIISESENAYVNLKYHEQRANVDLSIEKVAPHEQIGALLILSDFFKKQIMDILNTLHNESFPYSESESILYSEYYQDKIILDKVDEDDMESMVIFEDDLCFIARMVMGLKYEDWRPERQIRNCFIELLNGANFDVDKLDYIVRDTQMSGISNISVDIDRLLSSLCIVTKTKHFNKTNLKNKKLQRMTIVHIKNTSKNSRFHIEGEFQGTIIIKKNANVTIEEGSKFDSLIGVEQGMAKIKYHNAEIAKFDSNTVVYEDSELVPHDEAENGEKIIQLRGKGGNRQFSCDIKNATVLKQFRFVTATDIVLKIHENCNITINGEFYSDRPIRLFNVKDMSGDISEIEMLGDTFKQNFTNTKIPGEDGYNTFSVGFKKQAINAIANVMEARNYLYLWIYAHHKVIYYANFLIPVLAKEMMLNKNNINMWNLDFDNIKYLDDAYLWTIIKYNYYNENKSTKKSKSESAALLSELFTRKYKKSLYKSLAEYDLFFEKYDEETKSRLPNYLNKVLNDNVNHARPYIKIPGKDGKDKFIVGYFKDAELKKINQGLKSIINEKFAQENIPKEYENLSLSELVYVSAEYKMKQLETLKTFVDMNDDIIPISHIPLLEAQTKKAEQNTSNTYFYLYYQTTSTKTNSNRECEFVKEAVKKYFADLVESNS